MSRFSEWLDPVRPRPPALRRRWWARILLWLFDLPLALSVGALFLVGMALALAAGYVCQ